MFNRLIRFSLDKPKWIYALTLALTCLALAMIPAIEIDTDPENMLSSDDPARQYHNQIKQTFNMPDMIVLGAVNTEQGIYNQQSLQRMHLLVKEILLIDGVIDKDMLALPLVDNIRQNDAADGIRFEWLMATPPKSASEVAELKKSAQRLPMLTNTLVSEDGLAAAIYIPIESKNISYRVAEQIRSLVAEHGGDSYFITGLPVAEDQFGYEMFVQMGVAAPLAGLAIFLLLWVFFKNLNLIIAPMLVAMATVIIIMGALIGLGFTVHIMSSMIAIFLMPIAVVDSVHVLSEFADRYKQGSNAKEVIAKVMSHLLTPMLFTSITSAVGFFSLMLTPIPPVQVFGAFIGIGILLAFFLTITFIPAYVSRLSEQTLVNLHTALANKTEQGKLSTGLKWLGSFATTKAKVIVFGFILIFVFSLQGIRSIEINDNPINWFKADHEIRVADKILNQHFAGTYDAWLVFEGQKQTMNTQLAIIEPWLEQLGEGALKQQLEQFILEKQQAQQTIISNEFLVFVEDLSFLANGQDAQALELFAVNLDQILVEQKTFLNPESLGYLVRLQEQLVASNLVGKVNSLADVVRTVNRELQGGSEQQFTIPNNSNAVAQTLLQYQSSHRPSDLWHFVSQDYQQTLLWLQLTSGDNQHMNKVIAWFENYVAENPMPESLNYHWAGKAYINVVWQDAMVSGMFNSLLSSFIVVFVMMVLLFRSFKFGILAMLPLTFTITFIYGLIGWSGKAYDMPIAVLSALTLGLSIDFAIHFLQRYRELRRHNSEQVTIAEMFNEPARAIARNAIIIAAGFTPLLLSPLVPYITVGFFLATIMAASALVTLLLLPSLLSKANNARGV